jgi:hypothetical protein
MLGADKGLSPFFNPVQNFVLLITLVPAFFGHDMAITQLWSKPKTVGSAGMVLWELFSKTLLVIS